MNFFVDKPNDKGIKYVHIMIHSKYVIVKINDEKNKLYEHTDYNQVIKDLKHLFPKEKIDYMKQYIIDNLEWIGVKVEIEPEKPKEDGQQYSLF